MSMLNQLKPSTTKQKKRVGRGYGSTKGGHTSGRGQKGQLSRRGSKVPLWFEGGNLPLVKRLPMLRGKGLLSPIRPAAIVTLTQLQKLGLNQVSIDTLKLHRLVPARTHSVKIVATGALTEAIEVTGIGATKKAKEMIEKLGGKVV